MGHKNLPLGMLVLMPRELDEAEKIQLLLDDLKTKSYSVKVLHRNRNTLHYSLESHLAQHRLAPFRRNKALFIIAKSIKQK